MSNFMLDAIVRAGPFRQVISFPRLRGGFHVMPTSVGYECAQHGTYDWDGLKRGQTPFLILQHTIAGHGRLRYERRPWRLEAGQTMLVSIPHAHRYWVEAGEEWSFFWLAITGREALRLVRTILRSAGPVLHLSAGTVDALAATCLSLAEATAGAGNASHHAYRAIMLVYDDVMARDERIGGDTSNAAIDAVVRFIRTNLAAPLDIETLAAVAGISRSHFSRLFARSTGIPPAEFVTQQRMELAVRLLANGQLSVKSISTRCGYPDPNYFAKVFRRSYQTSPKEFQSSRMYMISNRNT